MPGASLRRFVRLPLLVLLLFTGLAVVLLAFPLSGEAFRRAAIRRWSRALCAACGLRLVELPAPGAAPLSALPPGRLILANHISWLDIFAINALCPVAFVAKAEIARWPLIGTLVARTGTLFIERGRRHAVHRMVEHIAHALRDGARVAVFPEGTTGDGASLLPFHANLLQAAIVDGTPVWPVGLIYRDSTGARARAVEFLGETTFVASMWRILGARDLSCEVHPLAELAPRPGETRHALSARVREGLAARLGLPARDVTRPWA
jgi:1-acyl-sn-glycerol-3-phosphate acyltransferase